MTDSQLVAQFEALTLAEFPHREHVRLAWVYLQEETLLGALQRFASGLRRFAAHKGAPDKYHETITCGYLLLIRDRMQPDEDFPAFEARNPDLFDWSRTVLLDYYTADTLWSERARRVFVPPDRPIRWPRPERSSAPASHRSE